MEMLSLQVQPLQRLQPPPLRQLSDEAQSAGIREICRGAAIAAKAGESLLVTNGVALGEEVSLASGPRFPL